MAETSLLVFAGACVFLLAWGMTGRDRIYQYPFLAGAAWAGRILPMAVGVVHNPGRLPSAVVRDGGTETALVMCALSAVAGYAGYCWGKAGAVPSSAADGDSSGAARACRSPVYSPDRLFLAGCVLLALAAWGLSGLAGLSGGYAAYFSTRGNYALSWRGPAVRYVFFMKLVYPGLLLCLMGALRKPSVGKWIVIGVGSLLPLAVIVFLGRRGQAVTFAFVILLALYFRTGIAIPRWAALAGVALASVMVIVAPEYRTYSQLGADRARLGGIKAARSVRRVLEGAEYTAFDEAAVLAAATGRSARFDLGLGNYNRFVAVTVPRQLVGEEFKRSLMIHGISSADVMSDEYGWRPRYGTVIPGAADAFHQFWFFGAGLYFVVGFAFRRLWEAARAGGARAEIVYAALAPWALLTVHGPVGYVLPSAFWLLVFLWPAMAWARRGAAASSGAKPASSPAPQGRSGFCFMAPRGGLEPPT